MKSITPLQYAAIGVGLVLFTKMSIDAIIIGAIAIAILKRS
jgi:hypothetical protein